MHCELVAYAKFIDETFCEFDDTFATKQNGTFRVIFGGEIGMRERYTCDDDDGDIDGEFDDWSASWRTDVRNFFTRIGLRAAAQIGS